jgi:hypothetical protein
MTGTIGGAAPACTDWARGQRLDPIGTAGYYQGFVLVEQPLPWPTDVGQVPELSGVARLAAQADMRFQAIVGAQSASDGLPERPAGERRVICYRPASSMSAPGVGAAPLTRSELLAPVSALTEALAELLASPTPEAKVDAGPAGGSEPVVDVLVCTHGRRDICCGGRGMDLVAELVEQPVMSATTVRLWRTSHTGGHRFAPTCIVLPSATLWAWADAALVVNAVTATGPVEGVVDRYRGCACLGTPAHQAVERAVLAEVGWPLLASARRATDAGDGLVVLETDVAGTWEAVVHEGRRVPQPECRTDPGMATKFGVEWVVEGLRQVVVV